MILLISHLVWIAYSLIEGCRESYFWHFKATSREDLKVELHPLFSLQRGLVAGLIFLLLPYGYLVNLLHVVCMSLIFSFFHNGSYYTGRNKINPQIYPLKWRDESTTSTAKLTKIMTFRNRTILMLIGIGASLATYLFL